jgi:hypothetical protein
MINEFSPSTDVRVMVFNATFNNIAVIPVSFIDG